MGEKGDKMTNASVLAVELMVQKLESIGSITAKKMFGGHGIFHEGKMFGIIDSKGVAYLKSDASLSKFFESSGSHKHGKMPYYSIPETVLGDNKLLVEWAGKSIKISKK
ncbi:TfoX/Sxy family protein [Flagellimonas sp. S3867]|uniref:TfoX/Sxy family protein n=1 Tax=Flagellimonas sp. S3867 TaxID=2768063 RepID=UPI0016878C68|nr:TfoX/Sxy family protein [Flagellimonas sp. S3867]